MGRLREVSGAGARLRYVTWVLTWLLASCGGGGSSGSSAPPPPSGLSYPQVPTLVVGKAMSAVTPTVTGTVTSYTVAPALPAGIALNASTGAISGTPSAVTATANYTVTASNTTGSTSAAVAVSVNDVAPAISYPSTSLMLTAGAALPSLAVTNSGGAVVTWSISPALPNGLTFSSTTGAVAGTPTTTSPLTTYTVTATNSGGSGTATLSIGVQTVLVDLGHTRYIIMLRASASRVLSVDDQTTSAQSGANGIWVLWNYATAAKVARGTWTCVSDACLAAAESSSQSVQPTDLAGPTFVDETSAGLEVRSASDGTVLATVPTPISWWKLATDGSYVAVGSKSALTVVSRTGTVIATRTGDYSNGNAFAAPGQVQIANGAAGANVVETVALPAGTSTTSPPFQGTFQTWFADGQSFLTLTGNTLWTYSSAAAKLDIKVFSSPPLPIGGQLGGVGSWFWIFGGSSSGGLDIYKVGASATPTVSYALGLFSTVTAFGSTLDAVLNGTPSHSAVSVIDLSGSTPVKTDFSTPIQSGTVIGAASASQWVLGDGDGLVLDGASLTGAPRYFGYGVAWSIAGSSQYIAVATASGVILLFDANTQAPLAPIAFASTFVALSSDGTVLAAAAGELNFSPGPDRTVNVYSLPSQSLINSWPYTYPNGPIGISLSASGNVLGQIVAAGMPVTSCSQANAVVGGALLWSDASVCNFPRLSPDGTEVAVSTNPYNTTNTASATNIFKNGALVTTVPGYAVAWLDNSRLLVNDYRGGGQTPGYLGATIYGSDGTKVLDLPNLPELTPPGFASAPAPPDLEDSATEPVDANSIYDPRRNAIYSLTTGAAIWTGPTPQWGPYVGAVAGPNVVFVSGNQVLAQPH